MVPCWSIGASLAIGSHRSFRPDSFGHSLGFGVILWDYLTRNYCAYCAHRYSKNVQWLKWTNGQQWNNQVQIRASRSSLANGRTKHAPTPFCSKKRAEQKKLGQWRNQKMSIINTIKSSQPPSSLTQFKQNYSRVDNPLFVWNQFPLHDRQVNHS